RRFSDDEVEKHRAMLASGVEEVHFAHDIARDVSEPPHPSGRQPRAIQIGDKDEEVSDSGAPQSTSRETC
ncbi:MAG: hypothetical protein ACM3ZE_03415, partial [Myxococcales bacterium]